MHAMKIETFNKEHSKLLSSIESDSEAKAKERLLSAFTKLMQPEGHDGREDDSSLDDFRDFRMPGNLHEKKGELLFLLNIAVNDLFKDVKEKLVFISMVSGQRISWKTDDSPLNDSSFISTELEEHIEKCVLLTGLLHEVQNFVGKDLPSFNIDCSRTSSSEHDWATDFHVILHSVKMWFENYTECVLTEIIEAFVFCNTEVMETLASLSQIRGSIDTALQKLVEVELERESLMELEKSYFMKVEIITEQQLALQEAASRDHDHLSWEEAEELANQVESCRTQLEQLHQSWNQKDVRIAALARIDASIMNSLASLEGYFSSLVDIEPNGASQSRRSNSFLAALVKPFTELESIDLLLSSYLSSDSYLNEPLHRLSDLAKSGFSLSESVWRFPCIIKKHSLFIWKVGIVDSIINSFIFDVSASFNHSLGLYQLSSVFRKKLEVHLQKYHRQYLKEKVILALLAQLDKVDENLRQMIEAKNDFNYKMTMDNSEPLRSIRLGLEEYCIAQENARAARSAANAMKEHVKQRTEALYKIVLEIFRIEWLHEKTVPQVLNTKVYLQNAFGDNKLACLALKTNRSTLLEKMQSSISSMAGSLEYLQTFEKTSTSAEGQIERALGWAYAGPNIVGSGNSSTTRLGIPSEFHDHLLRRKKLLWKAHEQASDIIKFCTYVIEFEASRESFFWTNEETKAGRILDDSHTLKQSNLIALTRLDNSYQSFARAEQEWKLSQNKMEAAAKSLLSATNELCIVSGKVKSASSDLQHNFVTLRECVYEASLALSSFYSVSKEHIALASECGSILEEVLVITESLHDVYGYAKEASIMHKSFMSDLSQAMIVLLPLEALLSSDVASMTDTTSKEKESSIDVSLIHGEGLYHSYCFRLKETCQILESLVPSITFSVKELYSMLAKLARAASIHAGNLNKALEGVADSEVVISQEISLSRPDFLDGMHTNEKINLGPVEGIFFNDTVPVGEFPSDDEGWISPPDCSYTSSQAFSLTPIDTEQDSNDLEQIRPHNFDRSNISRQETLSHEKLIAECINNDAHAIQSSSSVPPSLGKIEGSTVNNSLQMLTIEEVTSDSKGLEGSHEDPIGSNPLGLLKRGRNAYAMSALRQIEYKIEGRDIEDGRVMQASLLVDHLIKEATNIDNLFANKYCGVEYPSKIHWLGMVASSSLKGTLLSLGEVLITLIEDLRVVY
ncbi:hypothetical protein HPP92_012816 [Vanilla planifolia]|uniref:Uncharacterized protein n=1 Tax=Vanilla planifolia TaxID=51239 RepID=A0A835UXE4_VANPL|nr:hypothetical protein HPP92_012816 [Vanilla planifolia]